MIDPLEFLYFDPLEFVCVFLPCPVLSSHLSAAKVKQDCLAYLYLYIRSKTARRVVMQPQKQACELLVDAPVKT